VKRLELVLFRGRASHAPGDTLVVPLPSDERPLRGDAGEVDWRVCGAISRMLLSGEVTGTAGEAILLPGLRPLRVARVLLLGIGPARSLPGRTLQNAFVDLAERLLALRSDRVVLALPGAIHLENDGELVLRGCMQALSAARGFGLLRVVIPGAAGARAAAIDQALDTVAADAESRRISLHARWHDADRDLTSPPPPPLAPTASA